MLPAKVGIRKKSFIINLPSLSRSLMASAMWPPDLYKMQKHNQLLSKQVVTRAAAGPPILSKSCHNASFPGMQLQRHFSTREKAAEYPPMAIFQ